MDTAARPPTRPTTLEMSLPYRRTRSSKRAWTSGCVAMGQRLSKPRANTLSRYGTGYSSRPQGGEMRLLRLTLAVPLAMTAVGCINLQTVVKVKPDGSGTLHQTLTMNPQAMEGMMEAMAAQMGGKVTKNDKPS